MSTVAKALFVLETLADMPTEPGLTEVARATGLDKATARRMLVELERFGFVEQDPLSKCYRLGNAPQRLAHIRESRYPFLEIVLPQIRQLAADTNETVHLSRFIGWRRFTSPNRPMPTGSPSKAAPSCRCMPRHPVLPSCRHSRRPSGASSFPKSWTASQPARSSREKRSKERLRRQWSGDFPPATAASTSACPALPLRYSTTATSRSGRSRSQHPKRGCRNRQWKNTARWSPAPRGRLHGPIGEPDKKQAEAAWEPTNAD